MNRRLIVRPEAEAEMAVAYAWYEKHITGIGSDFLLSFDAVAHAVVRNPQRFPRVHRAVRRALMRRFPYQVFFAENDERVVILAVCHARRNPQRWQTRS